MSNQFPSWQNEIDTCFDLDPAILTIQSVHDPEKSAVSILDLNIDCLLKIFSYLAMKDLLNIEKISKEWKDLASVTWRRFTFFDCTKCSYLSRQRSDTFRSLSRCGAYVKTISFPETVDSKFMSLIARSCHRLEHGILTGSQTILSGEADTCKVLNKLKHAEFIGNIVPCKKILASLTNVRIIDFNFFSLKPAPMLSINFKVLPSSVTELNFGGIDTMNLKFFQRIVKNFPNLEVLKLSAYVKYRVMVEKIAELSKLKQLTIYNCQMRSKDLGLLMSLTRLEKLVLTQAQEMNDSFLQNVAYSLLNLKYLDIHGATKKNITDKGVKKLAQLKYLEHLNLSYYTKITHRGLAAIAAKGMLKEVILISTNIQNNVIPALLAHCPLMELLDLSSCRDITSEAVETLIGIFNLNNRRVKLTVIVGGTEYDSALRKAKDVYLRNLTILGKINNYKTDLEPQERFMIVYENYNGDNYDMRWDMNDNSDRESDWEDFEMSLSYLRNPEADFAYSFGNMNRQRHQSNRRLGYYMDTF